MPMLPFAARRLVVRYLRPSPSLSTAFRHASTKPKPKSRIVEAVTNPAPPVLARFPTIYYSLQSVKYFIGLALGLHIFVEYFFSFSQAEGISMTPTFNATGDWVLLSKRYRRGRDVVVGDLISYKHPIDPNTYGVKRVLGMPGDFVLRDSPETSGLMIQVPEGHCYIVGDNYKYSRDSRMFGPLPLGLISAKVIGKWSTSETKWTDMSGDGLQPANTYEGEDEVR